MCCSRYCYDPFGDIRQKRDDEPSPAQHTAYISRADIATALVANIQTGPPFGPIVPGRKATEQIRSYDHGKILATHRVCGRKRYAHVRRPRYLLSAGRLCNKDRASWKRKVGPTKNFLPVRRPLLSARCSFEPQNL